MSLGNMSLGTPFSSTAKRVLLCGGGELGKEVAIELKRLGVEVIVPRWWFLGKASIFSGSWNRQSLGIFIGLVSTTRDFPLR